jgi:dihydroxyacetone kinase
MMVSAGLGSASGAVCGTLFIAEHEHTISDAIVMAPVGAGIGVVFGIYAGIAIYIAIPIAIPASILAAAIHTFK